MEAAPCTSYLAVGLDLASKREFCVNMKNDRTPASYCGYNFESLNCGERTCENAPTPAYPLECSIYLSDCTITYTSVPKCVSITSSCVAFTGLPK